MLHVDDSAFEIVQLQTDRAGPAFAALCAEFPRLEGLVDLLVRARSEPAAAFGQKFQLDLIEHGTFEVPSLTTAGVSRAAASLLLSDKSVFYAFDRDPDLILGASFMADGFPLAAIVIASKRVMINLGDPIWGMAREHLIALQSLSARFGTSATRDAVLDPSRVCVVTGDANFAHNAWNQLSAFEALAAANTGALDIVATHEPLGPLRDLFPAASWSVEFCPDSYLPDRNGSDRMFVPLGSFRMSRAAQRRVQAYARSRLSAEAGGAVERIAIARRPMFWLSIRTRNRTAINQTDALVAVSTALLAAYPGASIVLDGHSLPADFDTNPSYDRPAALAVVEADRAVAREVIERLREDSVIGSDHRIIEMIGCNILDSIAVAALSDMYFCHHGTVQHKIGWFNDTPGIVHCNARTLALHPSRWVADKVEDGVEPRYIDETLIEDEAPEGGLSEVDESLRIECYRFKDLAALAAFVMETAREFVGERPESDGAKANRHEANFSGNLHANGEVSAMRPIDSPDIAALADFERADRLTLQRELLRARNECAQLQKAKGALTAEFVRVSGELSEARHAAKLSSESALRDEQHALELAWRNDQAEQREAELARRNAVAQQLNDELVRRDIEIVELRAALSTAARSQAQLNAEIGRVSFSTEELLATIVVQRAAIERLDLALGNRAARSPRRFASYARRAIRRLRAIFGRLRTTR